jgi:uncharacterized SAM-binding protein YcdF (DUF218 family)
VPVKQANRKHLLRRLAAALVAALATYAAWTAWAIWHYPCNPPGAADAALVLGATLQNGRPSPAYAERIRHSLTLYREGRVRKLIFAGGTPDGETVSLAEAARVYAAARGLRPTAMLVEPYSRITYENLAYSRQLAYAGGLRTFLIVSDPLHMRRAMRMARDLGLEAQPSATPTSAYKTLRDRLWFLQRETRFYLQYVLLTRFLPSRRLEDAGGPVLPEQ